MRALSAAGDPLERLASVEFERLRALVAPGGVQTRPTSAARSSSGFMRALIPPAAA
jgi:hypothetical protein